MKTLLILFIIISTSNLFSQEQKETLKIDNSKELGKQKEQGKFVFYFPKNITKENIEKTANYYKNTFSVKFEDKKNKVTIELYNNNFRDRMIIKRFFVSNRIKNIEIDGEILTVDDFFEKFIK